MNNKLDELENRIKELELKFLQLEENYKCNNCKKKNFLYNCQNCNNKICDDCSNCTYTKSYDGDICIYFCKECK